MNHSESDLVQSPRASTRALGIGTSIYYRNADLADIILTIDKEKIPAHSFLLKSHSKYFKKLFHGRIYGEFSPFELKISPPGYLFLPLLKFIYRGECDVSNLCIRDVIDVLNLCQAFEMDDAEDEVVAELYARINKTTVAVALNFAIRTSYMTIVSKCLTIIRSMIISSEAVSMVLSSESLLTVITHCSGCVPEEALFNAVARSECSPHEKLQLLSRLEFSKIPASYVLEQINPELYMAIQQMKVPKKIINQSLTKTARVIQGINGEHLMTSGDRYAYHGVDRSPILVDLGECFIVNNVRFTLANSARYYIEISKNTNDWLRIIDHSSTFCRARQVLYFPEIILRYVRIVGIECRRRNVNFARFQCNAFVVQFDEGGPKIVDGYTVPKCNVAMNSMALTKTTNFGITVYDEQLLNGRFEEDGIFTAYTKQLMVDGGIEVRFNQPYLLNSCKFFLWDFDGREYKYRVETSLDGEHFEFAYESDETTSGWQMINFSPRPISVISVRGLKCRVNDENKDDLRLVHFEAPIIDGLWM